MTSRPELKEYALKWKELTEKIRVADAAINHNTNLKSSLSSELQTITERLSETVGRNKTKTLLRLDANNFLLISYVPSFSFCAAIDVLEVQS